MNLTTQYLGLTLKNPLVPSASPLAKSLSVARELEDHGAAAIILWSLFEESVTAESEGMVRFLHHQETGFAEIGEQIRPAYHDFENILDHYLEHIHKLKQTLAIPIIASLNGVTLSGWVRHAAQLQQAGADALELNVYYIAADLNQSGSQVEERYINLLKEIRSQIQIPINLKLSPAFSSLGHIIQRLAAAGAQGVALFNRFYQPDIDIQGLRLQSSLRPSTSAEILPSMRWIALLYKRIEGLSLSATSGVHTAEDVIKLLLAGADVVHVCSVLLKQGPAQLTVLLRGLQDWMTEQEFESIDDFRGKVSALTVQDPAGFERANYVRILDTYSASPGVRF